MIKFYGLLSDGTIGVTSDVGDGPTFDFPANFNFDEQNYFKIVDGQLIEDIEKRMIDEAVEEACRQEQLNRSTIADLEDICCDLDMRIAELEGQNG